MVSSWNLKLDASKCVVLYFSCGNFDLSKLGDMVCYNLGGNPLPFVESHRDLALIIVTKLKFYNHVYAVVWYRMLKVWLICSPDPLLTGDQTLLSHFLSHILSVLGFCSCVPGN